MHIFALGGFIFSSVESKPDGPCPPECQGTVPTEPAPPGPITSQREKRPARPPKKKFQKAGLYSDVYKTDECVFFSPSLLFVVSLIAKPQHCCFKTRFFNPPHLVALGVSSCS